MYIHATQQDTFQDTQTTQQDTFQDKQTTQQDTDNKHSYIKQDIWQRTNLNFACVVRALQCACVLRALQAVGTKARGAARVPRV